MHYSSHHFNLNDPSQWSNIPSKTNKTDENILCTLQIPSLCIQYTLPITPTFTIQYNNLSFNFLSAFNYVAKPQKQRRRLRGRRRYMSTSPIYRYWNGRLKDHFYTQRNHGRYIGGRHGWRFERIEFYLSPRRRRGMIPIYRYWQHKTHDHFYTQNAREVGATHRKGAVGKHGYRYEGIIGYCHPRRQAHTVPLFRYWHGRSRDHFYTTNRREIGVTRSGRRGRHGYRSEGTVCYVYKHRRIRLGHSRGRAKCDERLRGRKDNGYRGCQTRTVKGYRCQKWSSQSPHRHSRTPSQRPGKGLGNHNFCRNPDGERTIWCYTTNKKKRWDYCKPKRKRRGRRPRRVRRRRVRRRRKDGRLYNKYYNRMKKVGKKIGKLLNKVEGNYRTSRRPRKQNMQNMNNMIGGWIFGYPAPSGWDGSQAFISGMTGGVSGVRRLINIMDEEVREVKGIKDWRVGKCVGNVCVRYDYLDRNVMVEYVSDVNDVIRDGNGYFGEYVLEMNVSDRCSDGLMMRDLLGYSVCVENDSNGLWRVIVFERDGNVKRMDVMNEDVWDRMFDVNGSGDYVRKMCVYIGENEMCVEVIDEEKGEMNVVLVKMLDIMKI